MGIAFDELGNTTGALKQMKTAVKIDNLNPEYWYIMGDVQEKLGHVQDAILSYQKVIELDPHNSEIWLDYSALLFQEEKFEEALGIMDEGLQQHPDDASLLYRKSAYLIKMGKVKQGYEKLESALDINFDKHMEMMDYMPQLKHDKNILDLIGIFSNKKSQGI